MRFYLTVHGTYLTSIITEHMAWKPLLVKSSNTTLQDSQKSNVTFKHQTQYNYKDQKLHRRDKATMFLQHVKYQDLLTGYVRVIRKHGGEKVNLHTILVSLKLKYIKIDFHFGSISIKKLKIKFKVTYY